MTIEEEDEKLINDRENKKEDKSDDIIKWSEKVREKYNELHNIVLDNLPDLWEPLEFALCVKTILNIKGCTLPFAGIILGPPGSLKTAVIQLLRGYKHSFYTDSFTAKSIISHNSAVKKKDLEKIDMLPRMENRIFLTPELAPIFSARDEMLLETLGILTRLLDGHGLESDTGAQGHRGYNRDIMFTWLGAVVDIPYKVHKHLSTLGPKLYFFRLPRVERTEDEYLYYFQHISDNFSERLDKIRYTLYEYMAYFEMHPEIEESDGELPKIPFNGNNVGEDMERYLIKLANLLSRLRAVVPTWDTHESQGSQYAYRVATVEDSNRAITQLKTLAKAHALSQGRNTITAEDDLSIVIQTVLSTCSIERSIIFDILIAHNGKLTTSKICESLNTTRPTALKTMTELKAVGLVTMVDGDNNNEAVIELKQEFNWFLTDRFEELRSHKEKCTPRAQPIPITNLMYNYTINKKLNQIGKNPLCERMRGGEISLCESNEVYHCNHCEYFSNWQEELEKHTVMKHPGKATYRTEPEPKGEGEQDGTPK